MTDFKSRWNERYRDADVATARPASVLLDNLHLMPEGGDGLDLAAGLGANAVVLARAGLVVQAWDLAQQAMDKLGNHAARHDLAIDARVRDVEAEPPAPESFDVIVVSRFLDRRLAPALVRALRPQGLLFYQTFVREAVSEQGPRSAEYRLEPNELLTLLSPLHVVLYREEGRIGDIGQGLRNEALLIGQRRD